MTTDIVPASNMAALDTLDAEAREVAITSMLDQARTWLAHAVESTAPAQDIADFKAFVATAAETAKRLRVSKEIQVDAEVMVRRTERALGQAIRGGQERGEIARREDNRYSLPTADSSSYKTKPTEFASSAELAGNGAGIYAMTDDVTDIEFDEALTRAQDEQNVSRANVVRKVREVKSGAETQTAKWERVSEMADRGNSSSQIARELGVNEAALRRGARDHGIEIRADRVLGNARRLDMRRVIDQTVTELASIAQATESLVSLDGIRSANLDRDEVQTWVDSLTQSLKALSKARNTIKESIS